MRKSTGQRMRETLDKRQDRRREFEFLKERIGELDRERHRAEQRAIYAGSSAEKEAFARYARMHPELCHVMARIVSEMGRHLASNIRPHAEEMVSKCRLELTIDRRIEDQMEIVRAHIPALSFQCMINPRNWR